ncbi:MAG: indole-3-glycerol-phosphate synthase [Patescibacteria group bacterium]
MNDFLKIVIEQKKKELLSGLYSFRKPKRLIRKLLKSALKARKLTLIAEIKRASPSQGLLIKSDKKIDKLLKLYNLYADAVSVVTDKKFFKGSVKLLHQTSKRTRLPILAKDFIIDKRQIRALRNAGASAVLLILRILTKQEFLKLYGFCQKIGVEAVCEVSSKEDILKAKDVGVEIFGINNRDLKTLKVDLERAAKLAKFIPKSAIIIAESGFSNLKDVKSKRIQSILVGTSLIKSKNLIKSLSDLSSKKL